MFPAKHVVILKSFGSTLGLQLLDKRFCKNADEKVIRSIMKTKMKDY